MKAKLIISVVIAGLILFVALAKSCGGGKPVKDEWKAKVDSLQAVIADKEKEIAKLDELVTYYAKEFDSTAKVNDSLQDVGVKTVVRYKTIRLETDTAAILAVCDSMATEYSEFIMQTKETLKAADSLVTMQQSQINAQGSQIENFKALVKTLEERLDAQEKEIDKWKKLAKRRGRAVEW